MNNTSSHFPRLLPLIVWLFFPIGGIPASADQPKPPTTPFVRTPPPGSQWSVAIKTGTPSSRSTASETLPDDSEKKPALVHPVLLELKNSPNGLGAGVITYSNSEQSRFYIVDGLILQKSATSPQVFAFPAENFSSDFRALLVRSFPGVGWLSASHYTGLQTLDDTAAYHFQMTSIPNVIWEGKVEAWVRVEDRHPLLVRIEEDGQTVEYRFSEITPFSDDIFLPPEFAAEFEKIRQRREAMEIMRRINLKP